MAWRLDGTYFATIWLPGLAPGMNAAPPMMMH
jgi:hypothetical protein